jgi:hypothetical protein
MKSKYYPPEFQKDAFHCIQCGVYTQQVWRKLRIPAGGGYEDTALMGSYCMHCERDSFWYKGRLIIPSEAAVEPAHEDLPQSCEEDYMEARDIFARSPRASAALLRLCVQKLLIEIGEKGKNINDDIAALVKKGLPPLVQKALDYCRVVGNNAVHPGEIDLNDTPEIAQELFAMVNFIVEDRITRPREIEELYEKIPESKRQEIDKRDVK